MLLRCALGLLLAWVLCATVPATGAEPAKGHGVEWKGWSFNWQVLERQGVVLTDVRFGGRGVLKYAGVAEVFVPYNTGRPRIEDQREHAFGQSLIPLRPGEDCLPGGTCRAYSADGKPAQRAAVVMVHEEPPALAYLGEQGRGKLAMLVLWSAYALGDYTYLVQWRFREDGCLMPQVGLTGKLAYFGGDARNSVVVGPQVRAIAHVHNVFWCLDLDVDGARNAVEEFDYRLDAGAGERATTSWTRLKREGGRALRAESFRTWRVVNDASKNRQGNPRSYELVPGGTGVFRGSRRERFAQWDLWVTRYRADEVPGTKLLADALPAMAADEEDVDGQDVVLWYMMSVHHQPRAEDWPAMPVEWCGFKLQPRDFLDASPVKAN